MGTQLPNVLLGCSLTTLTSILLFGQPRTPRSLLENNSFIRLFNIRENHNMSATLLIASKPNIYPVHTWHSITDTTLQNGHPFARGHKSAEKTRFVWCSRRPGQRVW